MCKHSYAKYSICSKFSPYGENLRQKTQNKLYKVYLNLNFKNFVFKNFSLHFLSTKGGLLKLSIKGAFETEGKTHFWPTKTVSGGSFSDLKFFPKFSEMGTELFL